MFKRIVEIKVAPGNWMKYDLKDIKKDMVIRMFEYDGSRIKYEDKTEFVALTDSKINSDGIYSVEV